MNAKERVHAALEGRPVDVTPVWTPYAWLYHHDHFEELTDLPRWRFEEWVCSSPERYLEIFERIYARAPFDILQLDVAPSREQRANTRFVERDGRHYRHTLSDDRLTPIETVSGHARDYHANETQLVFERADIDRYAPVVKAEELIARGHNDYADAIVARYGKESFILTGGVIGTIYSCGAYLGQTNTFLLMRQNPALVEAMCERIAERNIEVIRQMAAAGGDAIYIDDATATNDMISVKHYERFSLPYMQAMIAEIHRLGHKAIVIYFGGVADRLEQIAATGADGLSMETSMKSYVNDVAQASRCVGDRVTILGNVDPYGVLERASDAELEAELRRQAEGGRGARGFIHGTGSPITPGTPLARVQRFIELGHAL